MRLFKNKTSAEVKITDLDPAVSIPAGDEFDLSEVFSEVQLSESNQLIELLGQGVDKYQLNDGSSDLSVVSAIDLLRSRSAPMPISSYGRIQVEPYKASGSGVILCSHNFCSPCSWYTGSVLVSDEELFAVDADRTLFRSNRKWWIDLFHGLITREGGINSDYRVSISLDGSALVEGVDYIVDYTHGEVRFRWPNPFISDCDYGAGTASWMGRGAIPEGSVVTATYKHAESSLYVIKPKPGKVLRIEKTEIQHTQDVLIHSSIIFQTWMPNPADPTQMIPVPKEYGGELAVYKGAPDFVNEGNQGVGSLHSFGGGSVLGMTRRGLRHDVSVYPFDYLKTKDLRSSTGVELRIWVLNDIPMDGEFATVTLYCAVEDE